jgi:hypothetical protein
MMTGFRQFMNENQMEYSFPRYLLSKQSVDDRALNKDVFNALKVNLPQKSASHHRSRRGDRDDGQAAGQLGCHPSCRVCFGGRDVREHRICSGVDSAMGGGSRLERGTKRGESNPGLRRDSGYPHPIGAADVFDFIQKNKTPADLLIAHAFLDLLPMPESLTKLLTLTNGLAWLTLNFDGVTTLEPTIDAALDERIERCITRRWMNAPTGGSSKSGRHLFAHVRHAGAEILAAGASDWVVHGTNGKYPQDEAYFCISSCIFRRVVEGEYRVG